MFRIAIPVLASVLLAGCGGGGDSAKPAKVSYEGKTLVVNGLSFERKPTLRICPFIVVDKPDDTVCDGDLPLYRARVLIYTFKPGSEQQGMALIQEMGLSTSQRRGNTFIGVPELFEEQWLAALKREPVFENLETNRIVFPVE